MGVFDRAEKRIGAAVSAFFGKFDINDLSFAPARTQLDLFRVVQVCHDRAFVAHNGIHPIIETTHEALHVRHAHIVIVFDQRDAVVMHVFVRHENAQVFEVAVFSCGLRVE